MSALIIIIIFALVYSHREITTPKRDDLSDDNLRGADLSGIYIIDFNLSGSDTSDDNLTDADATDAKFTRSK